MKTTVSILFLLSFSLVAKSQISLQKPKNNLSLSVGYNVGLLKDENFSPLNYSENGLTYSIDYLRLNPEKNQLFKVQVDFMSNDLITDASSDFISKLISGNLSFDYQRKLTNSKENFNLYLGGGYQSNINYINYNDQDAFSYFMSHGLNLSATAFLNISEKSHFESTIHIPLFEMVVQPPYAGNDEILEENQEKPFSLITNGEFTSLNTYFALFWTASWVHHVSDKIQLRAEYKFQYQKASTTHLFIQNQNQLCAGATYMF